MAVNRVVRVARTPDSRTRSQAKAANKAAANRVVAEANRAAKRESRFGEHRKPRESGAFQSRARQKLRLLGRGDCAHAFIPAGISAGRTLAQAPATERRHEAESFANGSVGLGPCARL